jgi:LysR family hca operon transcriptional activator
VVEEGLTTAAERRLHITQPSLSRQIRDLEYQVRAVVLSRSVRGVELTVAGKAFLDHARLAPAQVDADGGGRPQRGPPSLGNWTLPSCGRNRVSTLVAKSWTRSR